MSTQENAHRYDTAIAIVGMGGRWPGADNPAEFWQNLQNGVESIAALTREEVLGAGEDPALVDDPRYVRAGGILKHTDQFDAAFFGYSPREAMITDPQQRIFLEVAWEALEHAGYDTEQYEGRVGVFAGAGPSGYLISLLARPDLVRSAGLYQLILGNDKDHLSTRVSYKLNLKGPSMAVQTACSTSMVAVHMAAQSLLNGECDMALAGGISVRHPQKQGYLYQEGGVLSPDGHCRAFDADARGTVSGSGAGAVVLKRYADAVRDGDQIYALILGSAINNDGADKIGYTAPSVDGQAAVVAEALAAAGAEADTISYVEAHGTGTAVGDPIEITGLTQAFRETTDAKGYCAIGSAKTNVGHLDSAAGVTGLIKTALALRHKELPPSLHFRSPNPKIDFASTPFYVNDKRTPWVAGKQPRRAGVSSFGLGGTNAHLVLEEAPVVERKGRSRPWQLLTLSARTETALETATDNLSAHLAAGSGANLADVAFTLQVGRRAMAHRRFAVCRTAAEAAEALRERTPAAVVTSMAPETQPRVGFMFPGQGSQYINMARELYEQEGLFRGEVDDCAALLAPHLGHDLRQILFPGPGQEEEAGRLLRQTALTQPALFVVEYALARLFMAWGVSPAAMIGHSVGEYVAACLAGVFRLEDALRLVAARGRLIQRLPEGAMLSVALSEQRVTPYLGPALSLAAVNGPELCVVSGPMEAIDRLEQELRSREVGCRRLHTSHAFHSAMLDPILAEFTAMVRDARPQAPALPFVSNVTGTWIKPEEATDPAYWSRHMRQAVRFADGVGELLTQPDMVLLEVGPGQTLASLVRQQRSGTSQRVVMTSLRHPQESHPDTEHLLRCLGQLWLEGVTIDWNSFRSEEDCCRVPLPTYPFERESYDLNDGATPRPVASAGGVTRPPLSEWFALPSWKRTLTPVPDRSQDQAVWLVLAGYEELSTRAVEELRKMGRRVITVYPGADFARTADDSFRVVPESPGDYDRLLAALAEDGVPVERIVHFWSLTNSVDIPERMSWETVQARGFYSLLFLAQAMFRQGWSRRTSLLIASNDLHAVGAEDRIAPAKATMLGACRVLPQEMPFLSCRTVDLTWPVEGMRQKERLVHQLVRELTAAAGDFAVAYRGNDRWAQTFEPVTLDRSAPVPALLRGGGVYLLTGGLGRIGLALGRFLAERVQARLVFTGRSGLPERETWENWLATHAPADPTSEKIRALLEMEALGAKVLVVAADVADEGQMIQALDLARRRFGPLHGVIHGAFVEGGVLAEALDPAEAERQFAPKVHGALVLSRVLRDQELDFCLLMSSVASIIGGLGFTAYSAANHVLDALALRQNQETGVPWISVNWDSWRFDDTVRNPGLASLLAGQGMEPNEGVEAFSRILSREGLLHVVVSAEDLQDRMRRSASGRDRAASEAAGEGAAARHKRPQINTTYVAPRTPLEGEIAALFQELLGVEQVGIHDSFFELGGHSLLGTQLITRFRHMYQVELALRALFEGPNVCQLAEAIDRVRSSGTDAGPDVMERVSQPEQDDLLTELGDLSDEEIEELLRKELSANG